MEIEYFDKRALVMQELGFDQSRLATLRSFVKILWTSNSELNLFSRKMTFSELIDNHIIDSQLPLKYFPKDVKHVADFGSGGGLPAVIFAIQFPKVAFDLYEKSPKKQSYLKKLKLLVPNIEIKADIPTHLEGVDLVTARAFKPINVILEISRKYYENKGHYFLLKGRKEKIEEERLETIKKFKNFQMKIVELKSPVMDVERNLVLF